MTPAELLARLEPVAAAAILSPPGSDVQKAGIVLAALCGALGDAAEGRSELLDHLAIHAGLVCMQEASTKEGQA